MKLDIYSHILPPAYFRELERITRGRSGFKRWLGIPTLYDTTERRHVVASFQNYQQVLTLSSPPIEILADPRESPRLARLANESMAEIVADSPELYPAFVAALPMNNTEAALDELAYAIEVLGARGAQLFSNSAGRPLDHPDLFPVLQEIHRLNVPIWLHPSRSEDQADYKTEARSEYEIWWALGWPYETSTAMARLVFSGIWQRLPGLKVITHHMGAMIPYLEGRIGAGWLDQLGSRSDRVLMNPYNRGPCLDDFRQFYADTALCDAPNAMKCGLSFFGAERVVFGTDFPFDREGGPLYVRTVIEALESLDLDTVGRNAIFYNNAATLLGLSG
jgi:predicted TIM-barrel fold metal-dependent hydrolase